LELFLIINDGSPQMTERFEYFDTKDNLNIETTQLNNLCGQLHKHFDSSGLTQIERLDFKNNPLEVRRQLTKDFKAPVVGWQAGSPTAVVEDETFVQLTEYDALNRMTRLYNWHRLIPASRVAVYEPQYNARGLLMTEALVVRATKTAGGHVEGPDAERNLAVRAIQYDAKGQRQLVELGNNTITRYHYDAETFRLIQCRTARPGFDPAFPSAPNSLKDQKILQHLYYSYDPVGNITEIRDDAYEPAFFQNQVVEAVSKYNYDSLYRLIQATGRENGAALGAPKQFETDPLHAAFPITLAGTLRNYTQEYDYDSVGNIATIRHLAGPTGGWTRTYTYLPDSNRLLTTSVGVESTTYRHDAHGNMLNLANVAAAQSIRWDYRDMIHFLDLQGGGRAYYNYDAGKQRSRKRIERLGNTVEERIDLGGVEIYRKFKSGVLVEEIESIHLFEGDRRTLLVDDILRTDNVRFRTGPLYRYHYSNHLGSVVLELDHQAQIISYEEYHPYGTSAYRSRSTAIEVPPKRYRYTGKERDEESGLYYHGARYYAAWLGRWTSSDPQGLADGINLFCFCACNPILFSDKSGKQGTPMYSPQGQPLPLVDLNGGARVTRVNSIPSASLSGPSSIGSNAAPSTSSSPKPAPKAPAKKAPKEPDVQQLKAYSYAATNTIGRWESGLGTFVGGVVLIGGSVVDIVGSGGTATPFVLMGATMALGAGVTGVTVGSFQLTQPVSQDNARLSEVTRLTMDLGSSPARLLAGTAGAVYTGDEAGLRSGVNIGGKIDLAITFGSGLSTLTRNIAPPNQPTGIPTWTIQYTPAAATDPNAANFLRLNAEWLQAEEGYVVIQLGRGDAAYRAEDAALRGLANK
jgi:RHS repeat-associated protein